MLIDTAQARQNMIENQVRPWEVLDARVLHVLRTVPREDFVPPAHRNLAFADTALPIGHGEVMFKPVVEGRILQALALQPGERVLEIGTGTGFLTTCLARLAGHVTSIEIHAELAETARANLAAAQVRNAHLEVADAMRPFAAGEPYDVVLVGGGVYTLPEHVRALVKPGGRLFAFVGESPVLQAMLATRADATHWSNESLFETDTPYLRNAEPPRRFTL